MLQILNLEWINHRRGLIIMNIKLEYNLPPIISFLHHAYPLGIFWDENNDNVKAWFCINYNYLFSITQGKYFFNFLVNYKDNPFLFIKYKLDHELKEQLLDKELSVLILENLSHNYYIELLIDEYHLSKSTRYKKVHTVHEIFINGIDMINKVYNAWTYENGIYKELEISFHEIVPYYNSFYYDDSNIIMKLYYRKESKFIFSKEVFLIQINNYVESINPYKYIAPFGYYDRYKNRVFGISAYQFLFEEFKMNIYKGIDVRYLRVLYEHFACMKIKLKNFEQLDVLFTLQKEIIKFYDFAEVEARSALMMGVKYNIKQPVENTEYFYKIINKLHDLISKETSVLNHFVNSNMDILCNKNIDYNK